MLSSQILRIRRAKALTWRKPESSSKAIDLGRELLAQDNLCVLGRLLSEREERDAFTQFLRELPKTNLRYLSGNQHTPPPRTFAIHSLYRPDPRLILFRAFERTA